MKKNKKTLLIMIASILSVMLLLGVIVGILEWRENRTLKENMKENNGEIEIEYSFYPADFERNIFEDENYQELMSSRFLRYSDSYTNVTVGITRENAEQHGSELDFLVDYIYTIIEGDYKAYNACFAQSYYDSGKTPKDAFTMQQLYHIVLTKMSKEDVSENGVNYTKFLYAVEYQINENNGTFRRDIGDGSRPQYLVVTNRTGEWKIESVTTVDMPKQ